MALTRGFIEALQIWCHDGNRAVDIKLSSFANDPPLRIFCYDYDIQEGRFVNVPDEIPTAVDLLLDKEKRAKEDIARVKTMNQKTEE